MECKAKTLNQMTSRASVVLHGDPKYFQSALLSSASQLLWRHEQSLCLRCLLKTMSPWARQMSWAKRNGCPRSFNYWKGWRVEGGYLQISLHILSYTSWWLLGNETELAAPWSTGLDVHRPRVFFSKQEIQIAGCSRIQCNFKNPRETVMSRTWLGVYLP